MTGSPPFPRTAQFADGRLASVGGCDVDRLAAEYGTPLWLLDEADLIERMRAYREAFADGEVAYAAKACSVVGVLQLALAEGLTLDVASGGELTAALAAGARGHQLVVHGNNKSDEELAAALDAGVRRLVVDDLAELERIDALGRQRGQPVPVWLRLTPGVSAGYHEAVRTGTDDQKFGLSIRAGLAARGIDRAATADGVELCGLHTHVGSGVVDPAAFEPVVEAMADQLARVRDRHGITLSELNLGGGLGVAESSGPEPSVAAYAKVLRAGVEAACGSHDLPTPTLTVEPGRSLVGPSGITLYTVGAVKTVPGVRTFLAVDGGMSDNPRHALYGAVHPFALAGRGPSDPAGSEPATVVGKHCESGDVLGRDVELPQHPAPGCLLAAGVTGAYTQSMASTYNRVPRPAMVLVGDGRTRLLLRRESVDDLLRHDVPLPE